MPVERRALSADLVLRGDVGVAAPLAVSLAGSVGLMASPWAGAGDAFGRIDLWLYAALAGLLFRAPGTWLGFWTINTTGVQTYLIALTAMPFFAIALEAAAARLGWLPPPGLSMAEWLAAAIILADKSDVHRSRVQNADPTTFDIHDRVNYAATRSFLRVDGNGERRMKLELTIDTEMASVMDYFEIFLSRMVMCRRAAEFLGARFGLHINEVAVL